MSEHNITNQSRAQDRMKQNQGKKSKKSGKRKKRNKGKIWFYSIFFAIVLGIVAAIVGYSAIIINGERLLDEHGDKLNFGEASIIYDAEGVEIARLYDVNENREVAEFSEIPQVVIDAFVATEDKRFYDHSGLDFFAIGRAVVKDIIARSAVEGGSTITQQLAKNVFLNADKTILRKATEASIAVALENQMSKEQILTMYLNRIYYGKGIHGIKAAAEYYFDTELEDLELWQAATLAAMPKAPNRYNPVNNPEASLERRAVVLQLMFDQGYIDEEQKNKAKAVEYVQPEHGDRYSNNKYAAFIDLVVEEAIEVTQLSEEELRVGGFEIYTTLSSAAQDIVDKEFANADNFEESVDDELAQGSIVIIDHENGEIKALSGGRDYVKKGWNRATKKRQPGSAYKPLISYGPALESGSFTPSTILQIDRTCFNNYCPSDRWGATPVSMEQSLQDSRNLAAVWLLNEVGLKNADAFATKLGVGLKDSEYNLASALGGLEQGFSPLEMATAYSIIANDGKTVNPHTVRSIVGKGYKYDYKSPKIEQVIQPTTAAYLTQMLQKVVEAGTGKSARIDRPLAGKTGTTQHGLPNYKGRENRDVWFAGYSAEWTAAVWMGYDNTDEQHLLKKGSSQAASLFAKIMQPALATIPKKSFDPPIVEEPIEPEKPMMGELSYTLDEESIMVTLNWSVEYEGDVVFEVFRMEQNSGNFVHFDETEDSTTTVDMSVFPGQNYQYYVVAHDLENNISSEPSNIVSIDIPDIEMPLPEIPMDEGEGEGEGNQDDEWMEGNPYPSDQPTPTPEIPDATPTPTPTPSPEQPSEPTEPAPTDAPEGDGSEQPTEPPAEDIVTPIDEAAGMIEELLQ